MSVTFSSTVMSGEADTQSSPKGSVKGQSNAIFTNFSALLTSVADENVNSDSSSEAVTVRLGDFATGALENVSTQEFIDQIIGNDFIKIDSQLETLISEQGIDGLVSHLKNGGDLDASAHFNATAAFVESRLGVLMAEPIAARSSGSLTLSSLAELFAAIDLFDKAEQLNGLENGLPNQNLLEKNNLKMLNDLMVSVPIQLELSDTGTSSILFDIRDLKNDLSGNLLSKPNEFHLGETSGEFLIPQIIPINVENAYSKNDNYDPFIAVKVGLLDPEGDLESADFIELPAHPDLEPGSGIVGVTRTVEIDPNVDTRSKLLIGLSIPENSDLKSLPDFVRFQISLKKESPNISEQETISAHDLDKIVESALISGVKENSFGVKEASVDVKENSVDVKENSIDVKENSIDVKANSVDVKANSVDVKEASGVSVMAKQLVISLQEMSGVSSNRVQIVTKTAPADTMIPSFDMERVSISGINKLILNQDNEGSSVLENQLKSDHSAQNSIIFDKEVKLVASMNYDVRARTASNVFSLETELKYFYKNKNNKNDFIVKYADNNLSEQKNVSNMFDPKFFLEAAEVLRMKPMSVSTSAPKFDQPMAAQSDVVSATSAKTDIQTPVQSSSLGNSNGFAPSLNNKISLYDAQYASRISMLVVDKILNGIESFEINLEPESFGKIKVNVLMDKQGIDIRMVAETQAAASILRGNEDSLLQITNQNGMKLAAFSVGMQSGADQQRQNSNQNRNRVTDQANSVLERTKIQNSQITTSYRTPTGLNLIA
ncbi:flagellar hook-length control protein FliK [Planktomarina sp.]|nr:flagellar hook-length control protein FliK [Planktomarina sp.]